MAGETSRERYLDERRNVRAGKRFAVAVILVLGTSCIGMVSVFPVVIATIAGGPAILQPIADAAWVAALVFLVAAFVLAVALVFESRWLCHAFGAWVGAFVVMAAMVGFSLAPQSIAAMLALGALAAGFAAVAAWVIRRFNPPAV